MAKKTLMVMAGGTGGHVFGSGVTFAALTLACTEDVPCSTPNGRSEHD